MQNTSVASQSAIDSFTNAYMRMVIGDRLGKHLGAEAEMPDRLQKLLDQLRMQEQRKR